MAAFRHGLFIFLFFFTYLLEAQINPGDVVVLSVATNMGACGLPDDSDEISFVCLRDIPQGTTFLITDNGWEATAPGAWGTTEGTIQLARFGLDVPAGTVITIYASNDPGGWTYQVLNNNGWLITNASPPGQFFNLEAGGDQLYISTGGTVLYGHNTLSTWAADGTTHQSNLHPDVVPCYYTSGDGSEFAKYTAPLTETHQYEWLERVTDFSNWGSFNNCLDYANALPAYVNGYTVPIEELTIGVFCVFCSGCPPYEGYMSIWLPPGTFDVTYTDGTDTYTLNGIENFHALSDSIFDDITYSLVSVTEVGGCPIPADHFNTEASFIAPYDNPGTHATLFCCPDFGAIPLGLYLGPHDPGGTWIPPLDPIFGQYYVSYWGPGTYHYVFYHSDPQCPPDTASVTVYHVDPTNSPIEIGCDQNGTPNDITDDRMVVTITVQGPGFGADYRAWATFFGVEFGEITPTMGTTNQPVSFLLDPGTATMNNMELVIQDNFGMQCEFEFPLPPPGFCSDPCDPDMTASISGDFEMCPNTCPDEPTILNIDIYGGKEPYEMDFTITAPGFPSWPFTDIPVEPGMEIQVCVDNIAQPFYNAATGFLIIPQNWAGNEWTFTLDGVYDFYDCAAILDNDVQGVTLYPLPPITTTTFMVCRDEALHIDLTQYDGFISSFYDVVWYDGNPFQGGDEINGPSQTNLENVVQLWALIEDDYCQNAIQVGFTILPVPDLDSVPPIQICEGDVVVLQSIPLTDLGNSMATYTYHSNLPPDTSNLLDPLYYVPLQTDTIYVHATALMCHDTLPIEIVVQEYPDFTLEGLPCDLIAGTYSVLFTSSADSIHSSKGIVVNNPSGQDAITGIPNDSTVIIEVLNSTGMCKDTFVITAPNCNCPFISPPAAAQPSWSICADETIPTLSVTVGAGLQANWYDVPSGGVALVQNSLTFTPPLATDLFYVEAFDPTNACYSIRTEIAFNVNVVPQLEALADPVMCEPGSINFNTLIPAVLNGVGGAGQWYNLSNGQPVSGTIQPQNGQSWHYVFTSNPGGCTDADTIVATVNPLPSIDIFSIACDDIALTFDISFTSDADVIVQSHGVLTHVSGTDTFLLEGVPFDTDIQLDLQNTVTGCTATINQPAPDCDCPPLLNAVDHEVCSDQGDVDLDAFVNSGVSGSWEIVTTPPGGNPATLSGNIFQGQNADPGNYTLRYIRNVILDDCIDTVSFTLELHTSPFADAGSDFTSCAPDAINLSGTGGGSNVGFSWTTTGSGTLTNGSTLTPVYTPTLGDITAGSVSFTLTASDGSGFCPAASETITVTIDGSAYYILDPTTITHCDTADITVDLDDLVSFGTTGGHWFFPDTVSAPVNNNSEFNPTTLNAGTYTVFYTTTNAVAPCENDTTAVTIIIENCQCPSLALSVPTSSICSESATQDLNDFLITNESGTWSISGSPSGSSPAVINGSVFTTSQSDPGTYRLRFTLSNPVAGCPDFAEIDFTVIGTPSIQVISAICAPDLQSWQVIIESDAEEVLSSLGTLVSLGNDRYEITGLALATGIQISASNSNGLCGAAIDIPAPDCDCTLDITGLPDELTLCIEETITLDANVTGGKGAVTSYWIAGSDSLFQTTITIDDAGTYVFESFDEMGCTDLHEVAVSLYAEMMPSVISVDVNCPGDQDGAILLNDIQGGNGPFFVTVNGVNGQSVSTFPYAINGLGGGNYEIEITDAMGCIITFTVPVLSASTETLSLGPDETILVGDSLLISPTISFMPDSFYWTGDISFLDITQLSSWMLPDVDQTFQLTGIDDKGCVYSDEMTVKVLLTSSVYVPNVFSPNDDGINDFLTPLADGSITEIEFFEVYSRWGELVYSATNFPPGTMAWDGKRGEQDFQPGVFVYRMRAINKRGRDITLYGDVTLIR